MRRILLSCVSNWRVASTTASHIGLRQAELRKGKLLINNEFATANLAEWDAIKDLDEVVKLGYSGIIITLDREAEKAIEECAKRGIVVFNTPGANANGVKDLVVCGMLLACRDVVGGIDWVKSVKDDAGVAKLVEKADEVKDELDRLGK